MRQKPLELLPGTLDLLILKAVNRGPLHSGEVLQAGESSFISGGRKQLAVDKSDLERMIAAIQRVLQTA